MLCDFFPMRIVPVSIYAGITYFMVGLKDEPVAMANYLALLILCNFCASAIFMSIGIACKRTATAQLFGSFLALFSLLDAGFLLNKSSVGPGAGWLSYLSFLSYGYENLVLNEFEGRDWKIDPKGMDGSITIQGKLIMDQLGAAKGNFAFNFYMLCGIFAGAVFVTFLVLKFVVKEQR